MTSELVVPMFATQTPATYSTKSVVAMHPLGQYYLKGRQKEASRLSTLLCGLLSHNPSGLPVLNAKARAEVLGALEKNVNTAPER